MRKISISMSMIIFILAGCSHQQKMNRLYEMTFDVLLKDDEHVREMDYISLFIQRDEVTRSDFTPIERHIQATYQKETYSYTTEELQGSGAYGKESLHDEGVYLYITDVEETEWYTIVHSEKYYTVKSIEPLGMEMTFEKTDNQWILDEANVEWKGKPE